MTRACSWLWTPGAANGCRDGPGSRVCGRTGIPAAQGPAGSCRVATGVVINSRGDVLSVRIDQPATPASPAGNSAEGEP